MPTHLETAILQTVVYFDLFSYPLTTFEIWRNLQLKTRYAEVLNDLETNPELKSRLEFKQGRWLLKGAIESRIRIRNQRYRISKHKVDSADKFIRAVRWLPGLREIYLCNTLGFLGARLNSDIDFFIVTSRGRIWTVRFFTVLLAKMFFKRPSETGAKNAICLSFFTVTGANLRSLSLPGQDIYYEYWLRNLLLRYAKKSGGNSKSRLGNFAEKILRRLQLRIMPKHFKVLAAKGTGVVLTDEFLKFHDNDRREYFRKEFNRRFAQVAG